MKTRRSIKVSDVVQIADDMLAISTCSPEIRKGMTALLERILHETNNYNGFSYLREHEVPTKEKPGIVFDCNKDRNHIYPDDTRRRYYCKSA